MIKLQYCNIHTIEDLDIKKYLNELPETMRNDVVRYRNVSDQKARLLARLMLMKALEQTKSLSSINNWKRDRYNKPHVDGWDSFSISHSGEIVVFCHSISEVGIDIEKTIDQNYVELTKYFHDKEQQFIFDAQNIQEAFFEVWVKKEAFLKAIGVGIVDGLKINCLNEKLF